VDIFVKKLWQDLKDDDPIFIIHADHGDGFGEHGFLQHPPLLYEELIHVPLVIYNADIRGKISEPVSLRSIPSTIELIGIKQNLFPSKSVLSSEKDTYVISKVFDGNKWKIAVRSKDWKFIMGQKMKMSFTILKKTHMNKKM